MGWSINVKADKDMTSEMVEKVLMDIGELEEPPRDNGWGWSMAVDVSKPRGNSIRISGAGFSAGSSHSFAKSFAESMKKLFEVSCHIPLS